jgi:hypothetical protein
MSDWIYKINISEEDRTHVFTPFCEYIVKHPHGGVYNKFIYIGRHPTSHNHHNFLDENGDTTILHVSFRYYSLGRILARTLPDKIPEDIKLNEIALFI